LKQEQRARQRALRQRDNPNQETDEAVRPLGLYLSFQTDLGDFNDSQNDYINLRPSIGYMNSFGNFDIFCNAFYTFSFDDPGLSPVVKEDPLRSLHRGGIEANAAYTFDITERVTLGLSLDNQDQFLFNPDGASLTGNDTYFPYAALEPLVNAGYELPFGDISLAASFPFSYAADKALDYTLAVTLNTERGFGVTASFEWWNLWVDGNSDYGKTKPAFEYGQTELVLNYWRGPFFVSLATAADRNFKQFDIEPYAAYTIKNITLFANVAFSNIGAQGSDEEIRLNKIQGKRDVTSVIPSLGVKVRF
jgi:hypothetical protein